VCQKSFGNRCTDTVQNTALATLPHTTRYLNTAAPVAQFILCSARVCIPRATSRLDSTWFALFVCCIPRHGRVATTGYPKLKIVFVVRWQNTFDRILRGLCAYCRPRATSRLGPTWFAVHTYVYTPRRACAYSVPGVHTRVCTPRRACE
jgi:hypothetical protein